MRKFCFAIMCLLSGALAAETIGNVEFQFPPSAYEWVLFTDTSAYSTPEPITLKMYTHKVGDCLEFFTATTLFDEEGDDEEELDEEESFETSNFAQMFINDLLGAYLPNHRLSITNLTESLDAGLMEWEMSDGIQVIFHGVCRYLRVNQKDIILNYMTTAAKTPTNTALWIDTLNSAKSGSDQ